MMNRKESDGQVQAEGAAMETRVSDIELAGGRQLKDSLSAGWRVVGPEAPASHSCGADATAETVDNEIARFGKDNEHILRMAVDGTDRLRCWNLVYNEYLAMGYTQKREIPYRYSIHDALPDTATFLVEVDTRPAATVTVFPDSPIGLPADEIFREPLNALREAGRRPVEIGRLTIGKPHMNDRSLLTNLFDILSIYARCVRHATDLVITVNPTHAKFYEKMLLFERIGMPMDLDSVCGAPAVLMRLDLELEREVVRWVHGEGAKPAGREIGRTFYGYFSAQSEETRRTRRMEAIHRPLPESFLRRHFVRRRPLIPSLPSPLRYFFEKCYPEYNLGVQ